MLGIPLSRITWVACRLSASRARQSVVAQPAPLDETILAGMVVTSAASRVWKSIPAAIRTASTTTKDDGALAGGATPGGNSDALAAVGQQQSRKMTSPRRGPASWTTLVRTDGVTSNPCFIGVIPL